MFTDTTQQLQLISACVIFGFFWGMVCDFFRAFKPKTAAKFTTFLFDIFPITAFFIILFLIGFTVGRGIQCIYAPLFSLTSCALYFGGISSIFRPVYEAIANLLRKIFKFILSPFNFLLKTVKKLCKFSKNFFYSSKICYTMKYTPNGVKDAVPTEKGTANEAEKGKYYY